jgi:hypothetical protein
VAISATGMSASMVTETAALRGTMTAETRRGISVAAIEVATIDASAIGVSAIEVAAAGVSAVGKAAIGVSVRFDVAMVDVPRLA